MKHQDYNNKINNNKIQVLLKEDLKLLFKMDFSTIRNDAHQEH